MWYVNFGGRGGGEKKSGRKQRVRFSYFPLFSFSQSVVSLFLEYHTNKCFHTLVHMLVLRQMWVLLHNIVQTFIHWCCSFLFRILQILWKADFSCLTISLQKQKFPQQTKFVFGLGWVPEISPKTSLFFQQNKLLHYRHMTQEYVSRE